MSQESRYVVLCVDPVTNKVVFLNSEGKKASKAPTGALVRVTTDPAKLTNLVYQDKSSTVEVNPLDMNRIIPMSVINSWPDGPVEFFASTIGFLHQPGQPKEATAAMLLKFRAGSFKSFSLVLGGSSMVVSVPFIKLLGLEDRSAGGPGAQFSVSINPPDIKFPPNRSVTSYQQITEGFKGSLSHPGLDIDWNEGKGVYTRYISE